jgi:branched-chain amino acid transport system permease protein
MLLYAVVFGVGCVLAGIAGALAAPTRTLTPGMGLSILIESFIVTVIGGMGSIGGALVAAILIGFIRAFGAIGFPLFVDGIMFGLMALVLVVKPSGLFGREPVR